MRKFLRKKLKYTCILRITMIILHWVIKMSLSTVLKERRALLGYTLLDIAKKMDVSEATVQRWESGSIKSLRYDRITKLADVLQVTPAYLMGWEPSQDEWTQKFCQSVNEEMMSNSCTKVDYYDAGVDYERLSDVAGGVNNISLSEACSIAYELGCSLDDMVGIETTANNNIDGRTAQFLDLFSQLSEEKQNFILASIRGLLSD